MHITNILYEASLLRSRYWEECVATQITAALETNMKQNIRCIHFSFSQNNERGQHTVVHDDLITLVKSAVLELLFIK